VFGATSFESQDDINSAGEYVEKFVKRDCFSVQYCNDETKDSRIQKVLFSKISVPPKKICSYSRSSLEGKRSNRVNANVSGWKNIAKTRLEFEEAKKFCLAKCLCRRKN